MALTRPPAPRPPRPPVQDRVLVRLAGTATSVGALVAVVEAGRKWR